MLGLATTEHHAGKRPHRGTEALHVGGAQHRHGDARESLGEYHVFRRSTHDGLLVPGVGVALRGSDEASAQLHASVAHVEQRTELRGLTHAARGHDRQAKVTHLLKQGACIP